MSTLVDMDQSADSAAAPEPDGLADAPDLTPEAGEPKLLAAWMAVRQAELMLGHLAAAPAEWPQNAIYCHSCITALRSVTLLLQKALAHEPGFKEWYAKVQEQLAADTELAYLKEARNFVLKQGALKLMGSYGVSGTGWLPGMEMRAIGPNGPELWMPDPADPAHEIPVDWRRLEDFHFTTDLRLADVPGLPPAPTRELKEMLAEKITRFQELLGNAERRFDPKA